ncbi:hypothetical protein [Micavibrio aeruginosavorus]|nr:hypothetical protein [Micavibrio aeruginosavorus]
MFAALPYSSQPLEAFELCLSLLGQQKGGFPESLESYLMNVINQAKLLSDDLANMERDTSYILPEAVTLALYMQSKADLAKDINSIINIQSINMDIAKSVLAKLGRDATY